SVTGGTITGSADMRDVEVLWNSAGIRTIGLTVSSYDGCTEYNSKQVAIRNQVSANIISMKNKYCGTDTIFGSVPSGGNGIYHYKWRKILYGSSKEIAEPDTTINLIPTNVNI